MTQTMQIAVLKDAMAKHGLDLNALSERTGIAVSLLRRYMDPRRRTWISIGPKNAARIGPALGIDPGVLIFGHGLTR